MKCPTCQEDLVMSDRQGIEIDYCRTCRGVWLDRGELDKIIERSVSDAAPRAAETRYESRDRRRDHDDDGRRHKHHRSRSWLSDLFD